MPRTTSCLLGSVAPLRVAALSSSLVFSVACLPSIEPRPVVAPASPAESYVVQPGETLWRIARRHKLSADELARANGITDVTRVRAGMTLRLPGTAPKINEAPVTGSAPATGTATLATPATSRPVAAPAPAQPAATRTAVIGTRRYPLLWPTEGAITSRFGRRDGHPHDGIDIGAPLGSQVRAAAAGRVIFSASHGGYGNLVVVRHDSGLVTIYAHNRANVVRQGDHVTAGQVIAQVGATGRASAAHLHFEVRQGIEPRNPLQFLPP